MQMGEVRRDTWCKPLPSSSSSIRILVLASVQLVFVKRSDSDQDVLVRSVDGKVALYPCRWHGTVAPPTRSFECFILTQCFRRPQNPRTNRRHLFASSKHLSGLWPVGFPLYGLQGLFSADNVGVPTPKAEMGRSRTQGNVRRG